MKRKITKVSKIVTQLVDPKPEFVSIVDHGGNQTPFRSVKKDCVIADLREKEESQVAKNYRRWKRSSHICRNYIRDW